MRRLILLLTLLMPLLQGCATRSVAENAIDAFKREVPETRIVRSLMVGRWYGEAPVIGGGRRQWLAERLADGTFRIDFIIAAEDGTIRQTEVGIWGVSGRVYFTVTRGWLEGKSFSPADPEDASFYDAYEILEVSAERFRYRSFETGNEFELRKVGPEFTFPPVAS